MKFANIIFQFSVLNPLGPALSTLFWLTSQTGSDHHHFRIAVKSRFHIEEYSFGQTTLEQVFIEMAKQQEAEDLDEADAAVGKKAKDVMGVRRMCSVNEQVTEL